ncbi:TolC family protein [Antarcticibacterium flavum]|uniref:TolC family protein n=1 Tax=Antarcticibacterium flavum TaxID=2058175 RepID=A0A5B7X665_9FLAO|nr:MULTISPECIES: TolC family protein [Antarcticibacterium]MCM4158466.1 TolC family protein [Antarcticibacterium sp. W02-3]QCY70222.1 TolC family protein [Antarcticibacterium flavum]
MKKIAIIFLLLLGVQFTSFSQSLDEYLKIAAENNPELKAYFNEYLAALEKVPQVGSLPDPELDMGFFLRPMEFTMGNQRGQLQLMQMFPWFGTLSARKDEASKMALARYEVFQNAKYSLFYQVKNTWYQLYRLEEEIRITEENLGILKQYERLALIRFQSAGSGSGTGSTGMQGTSNMSSGTSTSSATSMGGMSSGMNSGTTGKSSPKGGSSMGSSPSMSGGGSGMSDVLRVRIEIKELENTSALLQDTRLPLKAEFNQLLNRNVNEEVAIADSLSLSVIIWERQALLDSITHNNPMVKMLNAEEEAYEAQKRMAKLEGRPMLGAGVNYMPFSPRTENGVSMGGDDMVMPMVRLTIPIYRKKYNAMQKEAELRQTAVKERRENTVNQLTTRWSTALRDLDDANRRTKLYREQTDLARQTLNLLMASYATDGRDFEEVLRVQQQLLDFQLKLITSIVDQHITISMLENLAATELN